jgi:outer membrane protein W
MTRGGCGAALAAATWLWSAAFCAMAQAQSPAAPAPNRRGDTPVEFDIPAQPMAAALNAWAIQADAQVVVDPGPVAHLTAPAIKGTLPPRQALRTLLARSNLQITQGVDGVFVIKAIPVVVRAAPVPVQQSAAPTAAPEVAAPPAPLTARASQGPWLLGVAAEFAQDNGGASGGASAAVDGEFFVNDHWAAALSVTLPRTHSLEVPAEGTAAAYRASARLQTSALSLKYYIAPESRLDPYLGAGFNVTALYGASGVAGIDGTSIGPVVQAGLDFTISRRWMLNAAVSWAQVHANVTGGPDIHVDPVQFDLGFVYRFGAFR